MKDAKVEISEFKEDVCGKKIYLVCPVRNVTPENKEQLDRLVEKLESNGANVHYPHRDVEQNDRTGGYSITNSHFEAMEQVDEVWIVCDPQSYGSHVDLGMAIGLRKNLHLAGVVGKDTPGKSYLKVIKEIIRHNLK